jgi:hypothetical protein
MTGGKRIAILLQPISGVSVPMEERERCYSFILSRTPHETLNDFKVHVIFYVIPPDTLGL